MKNYQTHIFTHNTYMQRPHHQYLFALSCKYLRVVTINFIHDGKLDLDFIAYSEKYVDKNIVLFQF